MTIVWRPVETGDLDDLHTLVVTCEEADGGPYRTSLDEAAEMLDGHDLARRSWLGSDAVGPVAWGLLAHDAPDEAPVRDRIVLRGAVHPRGRGRGVGRDLFARQVARAAALADDLPTPVDLHLYPETEHDGRGDLARRHGFTVVRWFEELRRDVAPLVVPTPSGATVRPWTEDDDEAARRVKNAAFRDHWGSTETTGDDWRRWLDGSTSRRDLSRVAVADDGVVVGMLLANHYPQDEPYTGLVGWISLVAVDADQRGRGIAAALVADTLGAFRDAGLDGALLGVDAASPTGASRLYRRLGFDSFRRTPCWSLPLT